MCEGTEVELRAFLHFIIGYDQLQASAISEWKRYSRYQVGPRTGMDESEATRDISSPPRKACEE
jgi:hypothetical protein